MKRSKFSEEQIAYALRQADGGTPVGDVWRQLGVFEATPFLWKKRVTLQRVFAGPRQSASLQATISWAAPAYLGLLPGTSPDSDDAQSIASRGRAVPAGLPRSFWIR
jgi:hypothetical protein